MQTKSLLKIIAAIVAVGWGLMLIPQYDNYSVASELSFGIYKQQLSNQRNILIFETLCVLGLILFAILFKTDEATNSNELQSDKNVADFLIGSKNLTNDAYKIYLVKKYQIEKNDALGKIICSDKLFDNVDDALNYANKCEELKVQGAAKKLEPTFTDAICPNCETKINAKDNVCWKCSASFSGFADWKPIKVKPLGVIDEAFKDQMNKDASSTLTTENNFIDRNKNLIIVLAIFFWLIVIFFKFAH